MNFPLDTQNVASGVGTIRESAKAVAKGLRPILMFLPSYEGGIARYASEQSLELARRGVNVLVLATKALPLKEVEGLRVRRSLWMAPKGVKIKILWRVLSALCILVNQALLVANIAWFRPRLVLFDGYSELLAPLWAWPHLIFRKYFDVCYALTIHDPQRTRQFGPRWWHDLSVWAAYLPFSIGMVHGLDDAKRALVPGHVRLVDVPHGIFSVSERSQSDMADLRERLGIPVKDRIVLSMGFIADRKNLDIAIEAIVPRPGVHLLVAGRQAASTDRPVQYYKNLANKLGVSDRIHFVERYIGDEEIEPFFHLADVVLLTYKSEFVSQSGVLHLGTNWSKPVLASSGPGPLVETVRRYSLGLTVRPDSAHALTSGLERILTGDYPPLGWDRFRREASWKVNIDCLMEALATQKASNG